MKNYVMLVLYLSGSMDAIALDETLSDLYYNVKNKSAFSGVNKIFNEAKSQKLPITRQEIKNWLHSQKLYTTYFPPKSKTTYFRPQKSAKINRNKIISWGPNYLFEADLGHLPDLKWQTGNKPWFLVVIDTFTKFLWVEPLRSKQGIEVAQALNRIFEQQKPLLFRSDFGSEFYNSHVAEVMQKFDIHQYGARGIKKAAIAENAIKFLKNKIYKYMRSRSSGRHKGEYESALQDIVHGKNNSIHAAHKMKPKNVSIYNADIVFKRLYPGYNKLAKKIFFAAGDKVRLSKLRSPFTKGYRQTYTDEVFEVNQVIGTRVPPVYKLQNSDNEVIAGTFYAEELVLVTKQDDV